MNMVMSCIPLLAHFFLNEMYDTSIIRLNGKYWRAMFFSLTRQIRVAL